MTHASVFSGIGGPEVAAAMLGWENVFHCEINPFGRSILKYWFPESKSYEDITKTDFSEWRGKVDVLTGGFPCQPFSYAGQRRGAEDDRYLWPSMFRCIDEVQPTWVIAENVAGITTMVEQGEVVGVAAQASLFDEDNDIRRYELRETFTLERICTDLESHGYAVQPVLIPACAVGAPHRRDRVFIVARRIASDIDNRTDGRTAREDEGKGREERIQERHEVRKPDEPNQVRREGATTPQDSMHMGCKGIEDLGHQQRQGNIRPASNDGKVRQFTADTSRKGLERQDESGCGEGGQRLHLRRDGARCGGETTSNPDSHRGCEVDEHMESELADGTKPVSNGGQWNVADTESRRSGGLRIEGEEEGARMRDVVFGNGCRLHLPTDEAGLGRWQNFPSVSPVHRGNDGLPFDVDYLTVPPIPAPPTYGKGDPKKYPLGKWRAESLKAYGNAIVPQVMYEIFRAIDKITRPREN